MFGKHFASMYTGSMVGRGAIVFAVMGYVIANAYPSRSEEKRVLEMQVELNPALLAAILGEEIGDVEEALLVLCSPDANSRSQEEDGRRLVRVSQFEYRVVNGAKYRELRNREARKEQNRAAQERYRANQKEKAKVKKKSKPTAGQIAYEKMAENGASEEELSAHVERMNQESLQARKDLKRPKSEDAGDWMEGPL